MRRARISCVATSLLVLAGCAPSSQAPPQETAVAFLVRTERDMLRLDIESNAAGWVQETYITPDTELLAARAGERSLAYLSEAAVEAHRYANQPLDAVSARKLLRLTNDITTPPPNDPVRRAELATVLTRLDAQYGEAKACSGTGERRVCRNNEQLAQVLASSRDVPTLTRAWTDWYGIGAPMRANYARFVELSNEGARDLGFADVGVLWRSGYDMPPAQFEADVERAWQQVKPLYDDLHCYARAQLAKRYGESQVPAGKPIPAQLLGNLWALDWNKIYDDILKPYPGVAAPRVDQALKAQAYDAGRMTRSAQSFYESLGFPALPDSFWQRSLFTRPRDREVVCHASAWDLDQAGDVRIKVCVEPTDEDLKTLYHELGHIHYDLAYRKLPYLLRGGANDGFHEAIGDTVVLSMTPSYLADIGLGPRTKPSQEATINQQMKVAAERVAFLPFARLLDQWRWDVYAGHIAPADYNKAWWSLVAKYQGVAPPVPRSEADFDPGAKYHVPGNTPYARYFLAFILQFQFHKALCEAAGFKGPLHECSIYGNKEAGKRFLAMLEKGASQPWPDTLEALSGSRKLDGTALLEYFAPLQAWLKARNAGRQCGWQAG
jgi:peptidyl-dipeptidase A